MNLKIVTNHSESKTVHAIVDADAPEEEQPAVICSFQNLHYAKRFVGNHYNFTNLSDEFKQLLVDLSNDPLLVRRLLVDNSTVPNPLAMDRIFEEYLIYKSKCHDISFLSSEFVEWIKSKAR